MSSWTRIIYCLCMHTLGAPVMRHRVIHHITKQGDYWHSISNWNNIEENDQDAWDVLASDHSPKEGQGHWGCRKYPFTLLFLKLPQVSQVYFTSRFCYSARDARACECKSNSLSLFLLANALYVVFRLSSHSLSLSSLIHLATESSLFLRLFGRRAVLWLLAT